MRVGVSMRTSFATGDPTVGPRSIVAQAQAAYRAGLDVLTVGDHHGTGPTSYFQNVPTLGRVLAEWDSRPAGCLFIVPMWHPVLMAEQIATLAAFAAGPFVVQTGVGDVESESKAMGAPLSQRGRRIEEGLRIAQALLRGEEVSSAMWGVEHARVAPLPPGGVEWWMGATVEVAVDRAARLGDCWYGNADLTPRTAAEVLDRYHHACARHGRVPVRVPIRKDVLIAESRAEAEKAGDALLAAGYRGFDRDAVAYGDPDSVTEQLLVYRELGFTDVMVRPMTATPDGAARSVELAGEVRARLAAW